MVDGGVSTIFIAGLPLDAQPRELENTVRFFPGYEGVKIGGAKGGGKGGASMFVKFSDAQNAVEAMQVLNNQPFDLQYPEQVMRVEIARSDMKSPAPAAPRPAPAPTQTYQPPPPRHPHPIYGQQPPPVTYSYSQAPPAKRQRVGGDPGTVDTLALFGALEKGYTEEQLEDYFAQLPGFVAYKGNKRVGGGFVKFASPLHAQDALEAAAASGLEVQMARTSMSKPGGDGAPAAYDLPAYEPPVRSYAAPAPRYTDAAMNAAPPPSRSSSAGNARKASNGNSGGVDTLILQGVMEKGWDSSSLQELFATIPGYVIWKANPRVGGGFVKFADHYHAADALEALANNSIEAQFARSSMTG